MLRAIWALAARPQLARRGPRLVGCFDRHRNLFIPQRDLLRLKLRLLPGQRRRDRASPLAVEIGGILLVDVLLFLRRRIRAHDIETSVLHEIEIGVAAAWLAPSGKFRVAFEQRRSPRFLARGLLRAIGAFLEIGGCARPPLGVRVRRRQRGAAGDHGNQQGGLTRHYYIFPKATARDTISANCRHYGAIVIPP